MPLAWAAKEEARAIAPKGSARVCIPWRRLWWPLASLNLKSEMKGLCVDQMMFCSHDHRLHLE